MKKINKANKMKKNMKVFYMQPRDYGKRPNEGIGRIDMYATKVSNIYKLLCRTEMDIFVYEGGKLVAHSCGQNLHKAVGTVRALGESFFLEIYYDGTWRKINIRVIGEVPPRKEGKNGG